MSSSALLCNTYTYTHVFLKNTYTHVFFSLFVAFFISLIMYFVYIFDNKLLKYVCTKSLMQKYPGITRYSMKGSDWKVFVLSFN